MCGSRCCRAGDPFQHAIVGSVMDVYLVPIGPDRHELYCEVPDDPEEEPQDAEPPTGFFRRMRARFRDMLAEAERERRQAHTTIPQAGWFGRIKVRTMRWV